MKGLFQSFHIAQLILKSFRENLSNLETEELASWLSSSPKNRESYENWKQNDLAGKKLLAEQLHPEKGWQKLESKIVFRKKTIYSRLLKYAAAALVILTIGILALSRYTQNSMPLVAENCTFEPGSAKAVLILESGEQMELANGQNLYLRKDSCIQLNNNNNILKVEISGLQKNLPESYSTLSVPKGGEYQLVLSDGSKIWLNSDTKLRFPDRFNGNQRVVYLEGEAYFEVAPNAKMPFIVTVRNMKVEVLGTKFDVKAYKEDRMIYTTLLSGCVETSNLQSGQSVILHPNEQCLFDATKQQMKKRFVDAATFIGWKDGRFIFENEPLEEIMKQLCRWYNVEVTYQSPELAKYCFTGNTGRFDQLSSLLYLIEKTYPISFSINGNSIEVRKRIE